MKVLYFILVFYYICVYDAAQTNYCRLCTDHTLCKYNISGPGPACVNYDKTSLLTIQHIKGILTQINKRRNFIALGHAKVLPQAANMKKIIWSHELAKSAQRWADQCDPFLRPDRHDLCRDLEKWSAGQNIASIEGPAPGLNVKSFVEMWFMQLLHYKGSVAFYNQSLDYKTNYFTQLIWADTELVGCGRVKFHVYKVNNTIERLVCNFARRGNMDKRPVYVIGNPGTQCADNMIPDSIYPGLCGHGNRLTLQKSTAKKLTGQGLIKALHSSSQHDGQVIDPVPYNLKQEDIGNSSMNTSDEQKAKKTRHVFLNNTYGRGAKRVMGRPPNKHFWNDYMNHSQSDYDYHYHNRGHSRLYHGYEPPSTHGYTNMNEGTIQNFRRYEYPTEPPYNMQQSSVNYRKFNPGPGCTRYSSDICCANNQCTRRCKEAPVCLHVTPIWPTPCCQLPGCCENPKLFQYPPIPIPAPIPIPDPIVNNECQCSKLPCPIPCCKIHGEYPFRPMPLPPLPPPQMRPPPIPPPIVAPSVLPPPMFPPPMLHPCPMHRRLGEDYRGTSNSDMQYYDSESNLAIRSGDKSPHENSKSYINAPHKLMLDGSDHLIEKQHEDEKSHLKSNIEDRDLLYSSYDTSIKRKRQVEESLGLKPLWQMEKLGNKNPFRAKVVRYTTLPTKQAKNRDNLSLQVNTERITITAADGENIDHVTEKFLSFDELMHLRKNNEKYLDYELRRKGGPKNKPTTPKKKTKPSSKTTKKSTKSKNSPKQTAKSKPTTRKTTTTKPTTKKITTTKPTTKKTTTTKLTTKAPTTTTKPAAVVKLQEPVTLTSSEYTVLTTFERKKHCTRKLTCTWTAISGPGGNDGGINGAGFGPNLINELGSRTPPGYVEGCTRTSTCTRDFMDRNKISTVPDVDNSTDQDDSEDGDYCEKRSLNVKRHLNYDESRSNIDIDSINVTLTKNDLYHNTILKTSDNETINISEKNDCLCEMGKRKKRQHNHLLTSKSKEDSRFVKPSSAIFRKKYEKSFNVKQCPCDSGINQYSYKLLMPLSITILLRNILL